MEAIVYVLMLVAVAIAVGAVSAWLILRKKTDTAVERTKAVSAIEKATLEERLKGALSNIGQVEERQKELLSKYEKLQQENSGFREQIAQLTTTVEKERKQAEEKLALLNEAKEVLLHQFKNLANEILDEKSKKFTEQNKASLDTLIKPLGEKIRDFERKVEETYDKESKQRFSLENEVKKLLELNTRLDQEAINLTNALKGDSKTLGDWGEVILERVLEKSGLVKDREYKVQPVDKVETEEGAKSRKPDVVILLPENKHIVVDSKASLAAYERYCSIEDKELREKALKEHIGSLWKHIDGLSKKRYHDLYNIRTLDFVLMFIPIEPAFTLAVQHDMNLFNEAFDKNIIVVSPSTLLATLRTIASIWRQENQNRNALEIAKQAGDLYDKFVAFADDLEEVGNKIKATQTSYDKAYNKLVSGKGNLMSRAERIRELGAKASKKLPERVLTQAIEEGEGETNTREGVTKV